MLNIGAMVIDDSDFAQLNGASAIGYRDLMGESIGRRQRRPPRDLKKSISMEEVRNGENSCGDSGDLSSDGADSTTSSSSAASYGQSHILRYHYSQKSVYATEKALVCMFLHLTGF